MTGVRGIYLLYIVGMVAPLPAGAEETVKINGTELLKRIEAGDAPLILDVRSAVEYRAGHVPGAIHLPFWSAYWRSDELPLSDEGSMVLYCAHGPRAVIARFALGLKDDPRVRYLEGHMRAWRKVGLPETKGNDP